MNTSAPEPRAGRSGSPTRAPEAGADVIRALGLIDELTGQSIAGLYVIDGSRFIYANEPLGQFVGRSVEELLALEDLSELIHPDDRALVRDQLRRRVEGEVDDVRYDFRGILPDGSIVHLETHGSTVELDGRRLASGILHDITERKRTEEQYLHAQKMEAVGRFAAGIVHDVNNLLTAIQVSAEFLEADHFPTGGRPGELTEIFNACDHLAELTSKLLAFTRRAPIVLQDVDLNEVVEEVLPLVRRMVGEAVEVEVTRGSDVACIRADPGQIQQAVINLAMNGRDAMEQRGRLRIRTGTEVLAEPEILQGLPVEAGRHTFIEVADSGVGVDPSVQDVMFDPFTTTKGSGEGTGLGLSTVYAIVKRKAGGIRVRSRPGRGTAIRLLFPVVEDAGASGTHATDDAPDGAELDESRTVIVVDDDPEVVRTAHRILADRGLRVIDFRDGQSVLRYLNGGSHRADVMVSGVRLADMSGPELVARARNSRTGIGAVFLGEEGEDPDPTDDLVGATTLQRPFRPGDLLDRVGALLS